MAPNLVLRLFAAPLALAGTALCEEMQDFVQNCTGRPWIPDGSVCSHPSLVHCCPMVAPFAALRQRQAFDPLLLRQVLSLHPLAASEEGLTAAGVPPIVQPPFKVYCGLTVLRIHDIDQRSQTFKMHFRLKIVYRDCRLLNNCSWLSMEKDHPLWPSLFQPPWTIEEMESTEKAMKGGRVSFSPDGLVFYQLERASSFRCAFDFRMMPLDKQTCHITIMIPILGKDGIQLDLLRTPSNQVINIMETQNAEWEIPSADGWTGSSLDLIREVDGLARKTSALRWTFHLKRRSRSLMMRFVFPSVLYYLVSWLGLWIEPAAVPARATIGTIPVLMMTNKLATLGGAIPPLSYSVKLENFLLATLTFTVLQMLEFGFVNYALRRKRCFNETEAKRVAPKPESVESESPESLQKRNTVVAGITAASAAIAALQERPLSLSDSVARVLAERLDVHMRWLTLLAYVLTSTLIMVF